MLKRLSQIKTGDVWLRRGRRFKITNLVFTNPRGAIIDGEYEDNHEKQKIVYQLADHFDIVE